MGDTLTAAQRQRFPTLANYLSALPQGLDSYPQHLAKASLLRSILDDLPVRPFAAELPSALREEVELQRQTRAGQLVLRLYAEERAKTIH